MRQDITMRYNEEFCEIALEIWNNSSIKCDSTQKHCWQSVLRSLTTPASKASLELGQDQTVFAIVSTRRVDKEGQVSKVPVEIGFNS